MPENVVEKLKSVISSEARRTFSGTDVKMHIFVPLNKKPDGKWVVACSDKTDIQEVSDFAK